MDDKDAFLHNAKRNLRTCQLKQLEILKVVDGICRRHSIGYWLDGGSILGAVRHQGFIPWDDDIDIGMTLEDLQRFEEVAPAELPSHLFLQTPETDPQTKEPIVKVRDLNSLYIERGDTFQIDYKKGIYIDIFPFVPYPDISAQTTKSIVKNISKSYSILHHFHRYSLRSTAEFFWFGTKLILLRAAWAIICATHRKPYWGNVPEQNGPGKRHAHNSIFPLRHISFEGSDFSAPNNPDAYLTELYGDYMTLPPVEKRQVHAIFIEPNLTGSSLSEKQ